VITATIEIAVASMLAYLFLGETLDGLQILGGVLILAGIAVLAGRSMAQAAAARRQPEANLSS